MENWKMDTYSVEKLGKDIQDVKITIPPYQRGIVWDNSQRLKLIDSMKKGYPFGSILLSGNDNSREIVDGLQRSSTIIDFVNNPAKYFTTDYLKDADINLLVDYTQIDNCRSVIYDNIVEIIKKWVNDNHNDIDSIQRMQFHSLYSELAASYPSIKVNADSVLTLLPKMFIEYQDFCRDMSNVKVPALVYFGDPELLPEIFERINSQGSTLTKQEIYAAAWSKDVVTLDDDWTEILTVNRDRYDNMLAENMELTDYDPKKFMNDKEVNVFQLVFGFGKILCKKYPYLFNYDSKDPKKVESVGFNLINACLLQKSADMKWLNRSIKNLVSFDTDKISMFLSKILDAAGFVDGKLSMATKFKGNTRKESRISPLFSEFQIVSIIATVFINRHVSYTMNSKGEPENIVINCSQYDKKWSNMKDRFADNILKITIMDVLTSKWKGSGDKKLDNIILDNSYYNRDIQWSEFEQMLDVYFNSMNSERNERDKVTSPKDTEKIIMNVIYSKIFTADDQNNDQNFDIEHLATKDLMKKRILSYNDEDFRLPISSIGNICLLPEYDNRSKKHFTIYQDSEYLKTVDIKQIEEKYSFTTKDMMNWLDNDKLSKDQFKNEYYKFITARFTEIKEIIKKNVFKA